MAKGPQYDVIVIGAGHNGLTTAALLAGRGRRVLVIERREVVGGLAADEEFFNGYHAPALLGDTSTVRHDLIKDLRLPDVGLELALTPPAVYAPAGRGKGLLLHSDPEKAAGEIAAFSERDGEQYERFRGFIDRVRRPLNAVLDDSPLDITNLSGRAAITLLRRAGPFGRLGKRDLIELSRIAPMSVADWLGEYFETDLLKALLAGPAIYGNFMGPRSPGSATNLLLYECRRGPLVKGGPRALVNALVTAAKQNGVEIRTSAGAGSIRVTDGRVAGVTLVGGEELDGPVVAASCDPKRVFLELVPVAFAGEKLRRRIEQFRMRGTTARVNFALRGVLDMGRERGAFEFMRTGEQLDELEQAFDAVKYGRVSDIPVLQAYLPVVSDPECAPAGHDVLSVLIHFAPYHRRRGWDEPSREILGVKATEVLSKYVPSFADLVEAVDVCTPLDIETRYGPTGGHVLHGEHALDQLIIRPTPECSRYETPIEGLYLCGGGSHPGGGITCAPGALAARAILKR